MLTEYSVLQQENIFDLVMKFYNNLDQSYAFIQNNPHLDNINFDFANVSNVSVSYDSAYLLNEPSEIPTITDELASTTGNLKAQDVQNLFDVCGMTYGVLDLMYKMLQDNAIDSINSANISQKNFTYDMSLVEDSILLNHLISNKIVFSTGTTGINRRSHDSSFNKFSFN
jgi:hypothetical protein